MLYSLTIKDASDKLAKGEISSVELTESIFERVKQVEPKVGAYITLCKEKALEMARSSDERRKSGKTLSMIDGIPIAVKDLFSTAGVKTTAGSKILDDFIPPYESTVTRKLWEAGAVLVGKTNLDQFAMGSSTETSAYKTAHPRGDGTPSTPGVEAQTTRNPWDLERVPGGSSGGSAAAVASDMCIAAVGTDTGGSIRQPSSFCSITGLKPTYGRVSRYGTIAMASSLDQAGPMTKTVEDAAILLDIIAGYDKNDSTSSEKEVPDYARSLQSTVDGLRIGVPKEFFGEGLNPETEKIVRDSISTLKSLGASIVDVSLPMVHYALAVYYILMPAEVSSNLARYDGIHFGKSILKCHSELDSESNGLDSGSPTPSNSPSGMGRTAQAYSLPVGRQVRNDKLTLEDVYSFSRAEGFGAEAKRRIMLGSYVLSAGYYDAYYKKAQKVRTLIKKEFDSIFDKVDILATPVSPTPAFKFGEKSADPLAMYLSDIMTVPANPAGVPAISIPAGFTKDNLPVGLQLIGPMWGEQAILNAGYAFQQNTDFHLRKPIL